MPTWSRCRHRVAVAVSAMVLVAAGCSGARLERDVSAGFEPEATDQAAAPGATPGGTTDPADPAAPVPGQPDLSTPPGTPGTPGAQGSPGAPTPGASAPGGFRSTLWSGDGDRTGITDTEIRICAHAALTYAAAFSTSPDDLNVYWSELNSKGGVHGREVKFAYENDNYTPTDAVKAATTCKDNHDPFMLIGGIGFDQIPAVRNWAEQNRMLYIHHTATANGSAGKRYSFTMLPTTEKAGELFAEVMLSRFPGKSVGIIKRQSENWEPGINGFKAIARQRGINIVLDRPVPQNKGNYLQDIQDLENAKADVVFLWINALETLNFIKQAKAQGFSPNYLVFPFNLSSQSLGDDAMTPPLVGVAMFQAYSYGEHGGPFAAYASDMREFEAQYRKWRPNADLSGFAGDLLFLNWTGMKVVHQLLERCGPDCTRNRFVETIHDYKGKPTPSSCDVDFTRDHVRAGWQLSVMETYRAADDKVNWRNIATCVEHI